VSITSAGRIVKREDLVKAVIGREPSSFDRSLDIHISHLRKKLGHRIGEVDRIKTVRNPSTEKPMIGFPVLAEGRRPMVFIVQPGPRRALLTKNLWSLLPRILAVLLTAVSLSRLIFPLQDDSLPCRVAARDLSPAFEGRDTSRAHHRRRVSDA
jgi:Transcriptional regulatory protein, C terminal